MTFTLHVSAKFNMVKVDVVFINNTMAGSEIQDKYYLYCSESDEILLDFAS